jgi:hypothetical protein
MLNGDPPEGIFVDTNKIGAMRTDERCREKVCRLGDSKVVEKYQLQRCRVLVDVDGIDVDESWRREHNAVTGDKEGLGLCGCVSM